MQLDGFVLLRYTIGIFQYLYVTPRKSSGLTKAGFSILWLWLCLILLWVHRHPTILDQQVVSFFAYHLTVKGRWKHLKRAEIEPWLFQVTKLQPRDQWILVKKLACKKPAEKYPLLPIFIFTNQGTQLSNNFRIGHFSFLSLFAQRLLRMELVVNSMMPSLHYLEAEMKICQRFFRSIKYLWWSRIKLGKVTNDL